MTRQAVAHGRPGAVAADVPLAEQAVWLRGGEGLTGAGGVRIGIAGPDRLTRLSRLWSALRVRTDDPARTPVAFVSSVFDDRSGASSVLHVPAEMTRIGADAGDWQQEVRPDALRSALAIDAAALGAQGVPGAATAPAGHAARLLAPTDLVRTGPGRAPGAPDDDGAQYYLRLVRRVLADLAAGRAEKVVTARDVLAAASPAELTDLPAHLAAAYPEAWTFAVGGLVGATPEMLAERLGERVLSRVLAGSAPRGTDEGSDRQHAHELATSPRLVGEHEHAARSVLDGLADVVELDDPDPRAYVLTLPNIHHLATDVTGWAPADRPLLSLVDAIHPTAAVAGTPRADAVGIIAERERRDRGRYAGPVGWLDAAGDGQIGLALRCGQVEDGGIRLFAGGGIVAGADPAAELAETEGKLRPMREALAASRAHRTG